MEAAIVRRYIERMNRPVSFLPAALGAVLFPCAVVFDGVPANAAQAPVVALASQQIGTGDQVKVEVFGNPDLTTTIGVSDDGSIRMPLAGNVIIAGQDPAEAARRIENALKAGQFLVNPQVTVTIVQSLSQRVSVVGEVATPGRYAIDSASTVLDVIALAGGITEKGSDRVYLLRPDPSGAVQRTTVDIRDLSSGARAGSPSIDVLRSGDSIFVPKGTFFVNGQVVQPGEYRIEGDMLVFEAIARAGGVTPMGSASRVEIRRRGANDEVVDVKVNKKTRVEPGDVIRVKERLF